MAGMDVRFRVDGFEDLFKRMDEIKDEVGTGRTNKIWRNILGEAMRPVLESAKQLAPRNTGQLEEHIYMKVHKPQNRDKASKYYDGEMFMARVTSGTRRETDIYRYVVNKRGKLQTVIANRKPVGVSQEFGNARTPAHPFLRPALEMNYEKVISKMGHMLRIFVESYDQRKK